MLKKATVLMATLFFGSMCLGYAAYDVIAENVQMQIEENQNERD